MTEHKKKPNPSNSSIIQALLDLKTALERCDMHLTDIDDILLECQKENSVLQKTADQIQHSHKYPDKSIEFFQSLRYDQCPERFELTHQETVLLDLMERIQDPITGCVTVKKGTFAQALHYTDGERRNLQKYLDHLTELGFLTCIYRQTNKKPGEYKINQSISWVGKRNKKKSHINIKGFTPQFSIGKATILADDGGKTDSRTLIEYKEADAGQSTDSQGKTSSTESSQDSASQIDSTETNPKKQD